MRPIEGDTRPEWRVLASGVLACRLPGAGRPIWLDAVRRVRLCEHGRTMSEIHHRGRFACVGCDCVDAKGLGGTARMELPEAPPPYHEVLWRQAAPTLLKPTMVEAVRIPGLSNGKV